MKDDSENVKIGRNKDDPEPEKDDRPVRRPNVPYVGRQVHFSWLAELPVRDGDKVRMTTVLKENGLGDPLVAQRRFKQNLFRMVVGVGTGNGLTSEQAAKLFELYQKEIVRLSV